MKISHQSPINLSLKINQYDKVQRELNRLKFQLRMKRNLYDQTQFSNANKRIKECLSYFEGLKSTMIKEEANKILGKQVKSNRSKTQMSRYQNSIVNQSRIKGRNLMRELLKQEANYRIKHNQHQEQISHNKYVAFYELLPIQKKRYNGLAVDQDKKQQKQVTTQRYISSFQKNIKQQLNRLPLANDQNIQQFDSIIHNYQLRQSKIHKRPQKQLKSLPPQLRLSRYRQSNKAKISNTEQLQTHRYPKVERCKTDLSQRGKAQIKQIMNQRSISNDQKNALLRNYYQKYSHLQGQAALDLMCMASLARADLLLNDN